MPRTAITVGKNHNGTWKLLASPDVPLVKQLQDFRSILGEKSHEEFSLIQLQESDGHARILRLRSPKAQKEHDDRVAEDQKKAEESAKKRESKQVPMHAHPKSSSPKTESAPKTESEQKTESTQQSE